MMGVRGSAAARGDESEGPEVSLLGRVMLVGALGALTGASGCGASDGVDDEGRDRLGGHALASERVLRVGWKGVPS